jgi:hypothetical protein
MSKATKALEAKKKGNKLFKAGKVGFFPLVTLSHIDEGKSGQYNFILMQKHLIPRMLSFPRT